MYLYGASEIVASDFRPKLPARTIYIYYAYIYIYNIVSSEFSRRPTLIKKPSAILYIIYSKLRIFEEANVN